MGVDIQGRFGKLSFEFQGHRRKKKKKPGGRDSKA